MSKRESGLELLRIVCIFLIILMHSFGMIKDYCSINNIYITGGIINAIGNVGVSCFLLISGYFGIKLKADKFIYLIYITTLYTVLSSIICHSSGFDIIKSLVVVPIYGNWFISCYLILMLLSPFIDRLIKSLSEFEFKILISILFIVSSFLPTLFISYYHTVITSGGKCLVYVFFLYLVGRYIGLYRQGLKNENIFMWGIFIIIITSISLFNLLITELLDRECRILAMDCSPLILFSSIILLYIFKNFKFHSKFINFIAKSVLAVYLLDGLRPWVNSFYKLQKSAQSNSLIVDLFIFSIIMIVLSVIIDKTRHYIFGKVEKAGIDRLIIVVKSLFGKYFIMSNTNNDKNLLEAKTINKI